MQDVGLICLNEHAQAGAWDAERIPYIMRYVQSSSQNYRLSVVVAAAVQYPEF